MARKLQACTGMNHTADQANPGSAPKAPIAPVRRAYHRWVASDTLEDYALRYTPQRFRRWSAGRVANMALGVSSFLVLEALGATLMLQFGVLNAAAAIVAAGVLIALVGWPISVAAARHGVDMDLSDHPPAALPAPVSAGAPPAPVAALRLWPPEVRERLLQCVRLGYPRGVQRVLDDATGLPAAEQLRQAAQALDLKTLERWLTEACDATPCAAT